MNPKNQLASRLAVALSVAALVSTSAFADNRHSHGTDGRDSGRSFDRGRSNDRSFNRGRSNDRSFDRGRSNDRNFDRGRSNDRSFDRGRSNDRNFDRGRSNDRSFDRGRSNDRGWSNDHSFDRGRSNDRSFDRGRGNESFHNNDFRGGSRGYSSYDRGRSRQPYFASGRVRRYERFGGGYRVWLGGIAYPFFIPEARFRLFPRFYVGLSLRLGGYYNPLGYYDYYDGPYDGAYAYGPSPVYTSGTVRGVVESVDYRRGTFVVHDDVSGTFVTAVMRGYDRAFNDLRVGDYIEVTGDWTRAGVFEAYRVDYDRGGRYDRGDGYYR